MTEASRQGLQTQNTPTHLWVFCFLSCCVRDPVFSLEFSLKISFRVAICASLLKKSLVELYGEEKRHIFADRMLLRTIFDSKTEYFARFETQRFSFSTG